MNIRVLWHVVVLRHGVDMQGDGEGLRHIVCDCGRYLGRVRIR